ADHARVHGVVLLDLPAAALPGAHPAAGGGAVGMKPFDPHVLHVVPATRRPVAALAAIGVAQGVATIGTAFALAALVVTVVRGEDPATPAVVTGALFLARALLGALSESLAARAGALVATRLREQLLAAWLTRPGDAQDHDRRLTLA